MEDGAVDLGIPGLTDAVEVARGGFSTVFRARQRAMERTVAVKLIHATVVDPVAGEHFLREVRATGRLSQHPNVAPVYDVGTTVDRAALPDHAVLRAGLPRAAADAARGRSARGSPSGWPAPSPPRSSTSTSTGSSTATSSRPTSCSPSSTSRCWPTSAWPGWSTRRSPSTRRAPTWSRGPTARRRPSPAASPRRPGTSTPSAPPSTPCSPGSRRSSTAGTPTSSRCSTGSATSRCPTCATAGSRAPVADAVRQTMAKDPADRPASAAEFATMLTRPLPPPRLEPIAEPAAPCSNRPPAARRRSRSTNRSRPTSTGLAAFCVGSGHGTPRDAPEPIALAEPEPEPAVEPEPGPAVAAAMAGRRSTSRSRPTSPFSRPSVSDPATEPRENPPEPTAVVEPEPEPVAPDERSTSPVAAAAASAADRGRRTPPSARGGARSSSACSSPRPRSLSFLAIRRNLYEGYGSVLGDSFLADVGAWAPTVALAVGVVLLWRRTGVGAEWIIGAGAAFVLLNYGGLVDFLGREDNLAGHDRHGDADHRRRARRSSPSSSCGAWPRSPDPASTS